MAHSFSLFLLLGVIFFSSVASFDMFEISKLPDFLPRLGQDTIIGGHEADIKDHPHQAALLYQEDNEYHFYCAGVIISKDYVLTVAHCLESLNASNLVVGLGSSWRSNGTMMQAAELIPHPKHDSHSDYDVGLVKTVDPIHFSDVIKPIKLQAKQKPLEDDSIVTVAGWGLTESSNKLPEHLMAVNISVVNYYKCWKSWYDAGLLLTRNMWCGGNFDAGGIGPCVGDSGGAAVQDNIAVGLVSFGHWGCVPPKFPIIFTDIAAPSIRDFITNHTGL